MERFACEIVITNDQQHSPARFADRPITLAALAAVALGYCLAGRISLLLAVPPGYASAIWPSAGIALAAVLVYGPRIWPAVFAGSLAANLWISVDGVVAGNLAVISAAALIACGASLQALFSAWLIRRFRVWPHVLHDGKTITQFLLLGGPAGSVVNACFGVTTLFALGFIEFGEFGFNWLNWWVGDTIGVIVVTPIVLIWSGAMGEFWRRRAAAVSVPSFIALLVVISLFLIASNREQARIETDFRDTAHNVDVAITTKLNAIIAALGSVQSLFASSQEVDAEEFRIFTRRALRENPELLAVSWNAQVPHAQRATYEAADKGARRLRFKERNARGELIDAGQRASYTIVEFIEPLDDNRSALGFDVGFDATRLEAIEKARDSGQAAATARVHLVQAEQAEPGLLIFAPIYRSGSSPPSVFERREQIAGYAVAVVLIHQLLDTAISGLRLDHVALQLIDETDAENAMVLATWALDDNAQQLLTSDHALVFAGRSWRLNVSAGAEYVAIHRAPGLLLVLAVGLLLCGMLGAFNLTLASNEKREAIRAAQDALTGLANRNEFERRLSNALASCKNSAAQHAFAFCDLDKFKLVNDTAGHQAGDELLKSVAGLLRARLRHRDTVARLGGDEFGLLLEHCPIDKAQQIAEKVCADIRSLQFVWAGQTFQIGVSIGVIALNARTDDITDVMTRADVACYAAKDHGRNQVYVDRLDSAQVRRRKSELQRVADLRTTLSNDDLLLYKQPIWAMDGLHLEPSAVEVLLRLEGPDGEILTPAAMISVAERYGIMAEVDRWVIRQALRHSKQLCAMGTTININLSANSLDNETLVDFVSDEVEQCGVKPGNVCFEITETAAISNLDSAMRFMEHMKQVGCRFALDDFGAGISSFRYLKTLPVDYLKIDGSLIQGVVTDVTARAMVKAIQQIADAMGITTVAEWVSDKSILAPLQDIGVQFVQGFALGQPVPIDEVSSYVQLSEDAGVVPLRRAEN
ncbi:MAG: EAL domain-containing protein [Woeseia sp.]